MSSLSSSSLMNALLASGSVGGRISHTPFRSEMAFKRFVAFEEDDVRMAAISIFSWRTLVSVEPKIFERAVCISFNVFMASSYRFCCR